MHACSGEVDELLESCSSDTGPATMSTPAAASSSTWPRHPEELEQRDAAKSRVCADATPAMLDSDDIS
ncbi:MAG: hypothetical protein M3460_15085 [Actinomycetota bacterium]|nr:hypothetical protein [Actinomycetota bacterium]